MENCAAERQTLPPSAWQVAGERILSPLQTRHLEHELPPCREPFAGKPGPDVFLAPVLEQVRAVISGPDLRAAIESTTGPLL